jgi:2-polyprenyl-3-methyl-5-hydroxy-6-metoxy-1,4-benzoquinol methylase
MKSHADERVGVVIERDLPGPIDLRDARDAREWERTAQARPGRAEMFEAFSRELRRLGHHDLTVLDLGSGPGFLADYLLHALPNLHLTLLDCSAPMHELARARLGPRATAVDFVERSFADTNWPVGLGPFDAVVTNQAVHELRHKRHASQLHAAVRKVLKPVGVYLVSDHFLGRRGLTNELLYMTVAEQRYALLAAGFHDVQNVAAAGTLVMHRAEAK